MQGRDIEYVVDYQDIGPPHARQWTCYLTSASPPFLLRSLAHVYFLVTRVANLIYNPVPAVPFIGHGSSKQASKDEAAYNALRALGYNAAGTGAN